MFIQPPPKLTFGLLDKKRKNQDGSSDARKKSKKHEISSYGRRHGTSTNVKRQLSGRALVQEADDKAVADLFLKHNGLPNVFYENTVVRDALIGNVLNDDVKGPDKHIRLLEAYFKNMGSNSAGNVLYVSDLTQKKPMLAKLLKQYGAQMVQPREIQSFINGDDEQVGKGLYSNNPKEVRRALSVVGLDIDKYDEAISMTALQHAAYYANPAVVSLLLKHGANPFLLEKVTNETPLQLALSPDGNFNVIDRIHCAKIILQQVKTIDNSRMVEYLANTGSEISSSTAFEYLGELLRANPTLQESKLLRELCVPQVQRQRLRVRVSRLADELVATEATFGGRASREQIEQVLGQLRAAASRYVAPEHIEQFMGRVREYLEQLNTRHTG